MKLNNVESSDHKEIAEMFKLHFSNVYQEPANFDTSNFDHIDLSTNELAVITIEETKIKDVLDSLDVNKNLGPDMIPATFLRHTSTLPPKF